MRCLMKNQTIFNVLLVGFVIVYVTIFIPYIYKNDTKPRVHVVTITPVNITFEQEELPQIIEEATQAEILEQPVDEPKLSDSDKELLAKLVHAEAGNQPIEAQIAVAEVVLNRVSSPLYPYTISDVIYDRKYAVQFSPTANGALEKSVPTVENYEAVNIAWQNDDLEPDNMLFFTSNGYLRGYKPYQTIGDMYFSLYE